MGPPSEQLYTVNDLGGAQRGTEKGAIAIVVVGLATRIGQGIQWTSTTGWRKHRLNQVRPSGVPLGRRLRGQRGQWNPPLKFIPCTRT